MRNIPEDRYIQVTQRALAVANRQRVQQSLRRMFVRAIARIHHGNLQMSRNEIRGTGGRMAHHKAIGLHGVQIVRGVQQCLTLFQARGFGLQIHGVRAQPRSSGAKTKARARGILEKGQHHGFAAQGGQFLQGFRWISWKGLA